MTGPAEITALREKISTRQKGKHRRIRRACNSRCATVIIGEQTSQVKQAGSYGLRGGRLVPTGHAGLDLEFMLEILEIKESILGEHPLRFNLEE